MLSIFLLSSGLARAACFLPFTEAKCRPEDETGTNQLFERFCLASVDINNLINSLILGFQYAHYYAFLKSLFKKHCLPSNDLPSRDQRNIFFSVFTILGYTEFNFIPLTWTQYQTTKYSPAAIPSKHVLSALE